MIRGLQNIVRLGTVIMYNLTRFCIRKTARIFLLENKRFAGHSKWQNIKHIKGEKDAEKSTLYASYAKRMKVAIAGMFLIQ